MSARVPLLLLPGTLCTAQTFAHQLRHLDDICAPQALPLTVGDSTAEMAASVLERAPERFALAGFSQGAIVAFELLRQAPERIERLALLHANARAPTETQLELWAHWRQQVERGAFEEIIAGFGGGVHPERRGEPALQATILGMARDTGPEAFVRQLGALAGRPDSLGTLAGVACPTLLLSGRQDPVTPLALLQEIQARLPQALAVPLEDCGHYGPLERPQAVTAALRIWLQLR